MTAAADPKAKAAQGYPSLVDFYNADPARLSSREQDVGLWWRERADGPLHRAAWIADTGELYLARLGPREEGGGGVEVLARVADADRLERMLGGWRERCGEPGSLQWLRRRSALAVLPVRPRPRRPQPETRAGAVA
jgi:hypothetical protein